jgi:hypothetical protein
MRHFEWPASGFPSERRARKTFVFSHTEVTLGRAFIALGWSDILEDTEMRAFLIWTIAFATFACGSEAVAKSCGDALMDCSRACIGKKSENSCLGTCIKKFDSCSAVGALPSTQLDRGRKTPEPPRGKPGVAVIPPSGSGILDSGTGFGPQSPAAGSPPGGARVPSPPPGKIY